MGVFRYLDRWQGSIRDVWNREDQTDRLMALLEQRDRDLEDWLQVQAGSVWYAYKGFQTATLGANTNAVAGAPTFIINPGAVLSCKAGDMVRVTVHAPFFTTGAVVGSVSYVGFQAYFAGSPTGIYAPIQAIPSVAAQYGGDGALVSAPFTIPTTGSWEFTATAQTSFGLITYVAGYTFLTADHWSVR